MKVILLESVRKVGKKYEVVDVAPGYARNFLIPGSLAEAVTEASAGRIAALRREKETLDTQHKNALAAALKGKEEIAVSFTAKANEEGHLFAGIDRGMIAEKVTSILGVAIDEEMIQLDKPIKQVGKKNVTLTVSGNEATVSVVVEKE